MTPERWERLKVLFAAALDLTREERPRFVDKACGSDMELKGELASLLAANDQQTGPNDFPLADLHILLSGPSHLFDSGNLVIGRFQIARLLGRGGMGEVYEAVDLELSQTIALKTIRPDIAGNKGALSRFKKEVQLARRVSGPNVCRIHELFVISGEHNKADHAFLTMEYLDGVTLADKLRQSGPMAWRDAQRIAVEICNGLSTIHQAGIIHRDLKSRNIMLAARGEAECAVVMDFGLARERSVRGNEDQSRQTIPGAVLGTPEYMAPEQFEGKDVSPATDVYALGIILYELVTGKHPFAAETPIAAAVRRGRRPEPASSLQPDLPRHWDSVISKCLEYDGDMRFQSPNEVVAALEDSPGRFVRFQQRWFRSVAAGVSPVLLLPCLLLIPTMRERLEGVLFSSHAKHIAVLPFEIDARDPSSHALADGLMYSLSDRLADLDPSNQALWVVPASMVRVRKISDSSSAWREFGATIVIEGSIQRDHQAVHLNVAVIDTRKARLIGSAELDDPTGDLHAIEDEAMIRIARLINVGSSQKDSVSESRQRSPASYEDYLTALGYLHRYDKPGYLDLAISSLNASIQGDPSFALGYSQLGEAYRLKYEADHDPKWLRDAESNCRKASEMGAQVSAVYVTLAKVHERTGEHDLAVQELKHALELDSRNADALSGLANAYEHAGRFAEAEAIYKRAIALRPDYWDDYEELGRFYDTHGRSNDAIREFKQAIALTPDNSQIYINLGGAYIDLGDPKLFPEAEKALSKSIALSPRYEAFSNRSYLYTLEGRYRDAANDAEAAVNLNQNNYVAWANLATAYQWLGQNEKARSALDRMLPLVRQAVAMNPQDAGAQSTLALLYAHNGLRDMALRRIQTAVALSRDDPVVLSNVACTYESLGYRRRAIEYIQKAFQKGYTLADLKGDPELQALMRDPALRLPSK